MKKKVIVFGSCNLDLFFDISNMGFFVDTSPGAEDALHFDSHKQAPGGKGANQAVAAAKARREGSFSSARLGAVRMPVPDRKL
jgi:sugar/nucleoside kinase (ribokinase family)